MNNLPKVVTQLFGTVPGINLQFLSRNVILGSKGQRSRSHHKNSAGAGLCTLLVK